MIEQPAVEHFGGGRETTGGAQIGVARPGIAARVIVGEEHRAAAVTRRIEDDDSERKLHFRAVALMPRDVQAARLIVEMRDPQAFRAGILFGYATAEESARRGHVVELQRGFGTLIQHAVGLLPFSGPDDENRVGFGG